MAELSHGLLEELVAGVASGDREAFGELYRRCRPDLYRYGLFMTGSPAAAEDIVQDVFLAVIRQAVRYQPGRSGVLPWLVGITHNYVRRWRYRRAFMPLPPAESEAGRRLAAETDPVADLTRARYEAELTQALLDLPARYREVIVLCDLQEMSYEAAATALGCAVGTVRSRLHRGRSRLARSLDDLKSEVMNYDSNRSSTYRSQA